MTTSRADLTAVATSTRATARLPGHAQPSGPSLDDLPDVVARTGPDGVIAYVSPAVTALLGTDPDCLVGGHAYDLLHPDDVLPVARAFGAAGDSAGPTTTLHRLRRGDGSFGWYETTGRAHRDPRTGRVRDVVTVTRDASARVATEQSLADAARRCRVALDAEGCGVVVLDNEARVVLANAAAERLLAVGRAALIGRVLAEVVPLADEAGRRLTPSQLACAEAVLTGQPCARTVTVNTTAGRVARLHTRAQPVRDPATGQVREVVLTLVPTAWPVPFAPGEPGRIRASVAAAVVGLTPREMQVLVLLASGLDTSAAAAEMGLSVHTVRGHVKSLLAKLGAHSQVQAVVTALRRGIISVD
jgi:PAS domain S-box-containing protein